MKCIIILALVGIACASLTQEEVRRNFEQFKVDFNRQYESSIQEEFRREIFAFNFELIHSHNVLADNGFKSFRLAVNNFTDMTNSEFRTFFNGLRLQRSVPKRNAEVFVPTEEAVPKTSDWRKKGVVTPIKNQEQCGSCWAFSAVASLEGQHALKMKKLVSLSEQNLVDCSIPEGNNGCEGGLMDQAFQYVIDNKGIDTEKSYPYEASDDKCVFKKANVGATLKNYTDIPTGNEMALTQAIAKVGPISVAIDASQTSFQFYSSGVYDEPECSTQALDHGVTAVGYGSLNGKDYYIVKNSWGTVWGQNGYIFMSRNNQNQCGIATMSSYPNV